MKPTAIAQLAVIAASCGILSEAAAGEEFAEAAGSEMSGDPRFESVLSQPQGSGPSEVLYVGDGVECDESDPDAAFSTALDGAEIRLVDKTFTGNFSILFGKNLVVRGGFADCNATSPSGTTTLDAGGAGTVLDIFATSGSWTVELANLRLTGGNNTGSLAGGLQIEGDHWVTLTDVQIDANVAATAGGGIQITGETGATLFVFGSTIIQANEASDGGGIACLAPNEQLGVIIDSGAIAFNSAGRGGGIFAENCLVASHAGGFLQGIFGNEANSGGGIAALDGSEIGLIGTSPGFLVQGDPDNAASLIANTVDDRGGGAWLIEGSTLDSIDGRIAANIAGTRGGGVDVSSGSAFVMGRGDGTDCAAFLDGGTLAPCSSLEDNFADLVGGGMAISGSTSTASITQTIVQGNSVGLNASVAEITSGSVTMEGNLIVNNPGGQLVRQFAGGDFTLAWSTVADNIPDSGTPPLIETRAGSSSEPEIDLHSNIFANAGRDVFELDTGSGSLVVISMDCLISHELGSMPWATRSAVADPRFRDAGAGDYHIVHDSPAIDFCDDVHAPVEDDLDEQPRGLNVDTTTAFVHDVGADESRGRVFSDGFESD